MTKRECLLAIKEIAEVKANAELLAYVDKELTLLDRKSSKVDETKLREYADLEDKVYRALVKANDLVSVGDLIRSSDELEGHNISKITPRLTALCNRGLAERVEIKKGTNRYKAVLVEA